MDRGDRGQWGSTPGAGGGYAGPEVQDGRAFRSFQLHPCGPVELYEAGSILSASASGHRARFAFAEGELRIDDLRSGNAEGLRLACAAFEYLFATRRHLASIRLAGEGWNALSRELKRRGLLVENATAISHRTIFAEMFWQVPEIWMASPSVTFPRRDHFDGRTEHPLRPPKPAGCVYARFIPWLSGTLSLHVATLNDLPDIHRWMNNPRVNEFWNEAGSKAAHGRYLKRMFADPHTIPLIGRFNARAFSYFEIYWAKEDVIGPFSGAGDYDRGCHVIVGEESCRGKPWFTAWLPSLLHLMFLDDPRTERIVQEPSAAHHRQLGNLQRSGFSHTRTVDLPTKRAAIMSISRQRFFPNRLWHPAADPDRSNS